MTHVHKLIIFALAFVTATSAAAPKTAADNGGPPVGRPGIFTGDGGMIPNVERYYQDYSESVRKLQRENQLFDIVFRDNEARALDEGLRFNGFAALIGEHRSGKNSVMMRRILDDPTLKVFTLNAQELNRLDKADQARVLKAVMLDLEEKARHQPANRRYELFIENVARYNQGGAGEMKPIGTIVEMIASNVKLPITIESDPDTFKKVFNETKVVSERIAQVRVEPPRFDILVYHLRQLQASQRNSQILVTDEALVEIARIAESRPHRQPIQLAENIYNAAIERAIEEMRGNGNEARQTRQSLAMAESELAQLRLQAESSEAEKARLEPRINELLTSTASLRDRLASLDQPSARLTLELNSLDEQIEKLQVQKRLATGWKNILKRRKIDQEIAEVARDRARVQSLIAEQGEVARGSVRQVGPKQVQLEAQRILGETNTTWYENAKLIPEIGKKVYNMEHILTEAEEALKAYPKVRAQEIARAQRERRAPVFRLVWQILLPGPTGTGKTEFARQLSNTLGLHMERINLPDTLDPTKLNTYLGVGSGYVGYDQGPGLLTELAHKHPNMVLLLDEVGRGHPNFLQNIMSIQDSGGFTNGRGEWVDCSGWILVGTTNEGEHISHMNRGQLLEYLKGTHTTIAHDKLEKMSDVELRTEAARQALMQKNGGIFDEAMLARWNTVKPTLPLTDTTIAQIARRFINELVTNVQDFSQRRVVISDAAAERFIEEFRADGGSRSIRNAFESNFQNPVLNLVDNYPEGSVILVDFVPGTGTDPGKFEYIATSPDKFREALNTRGRGKAPIDMGALKEGIVEQGRTVRAGAHPFFKMFANEDFLIRESVAKAIRRLRI